MTETTVVNADLDLLSERVEKAAALIQRLKEDKLRLERECQEMGARLQETERKLQGQDPGALMGEIQSLRKDQRLWEGERREVASRIESLVKKLERLDA
jgi:predicted  nucleic acid-binding Zn-ribbon protein